MSSEEGDQTLMTGCVQVPKDSHTEPDCEHACHCMIFARDDSQFMDFYVSRAIVLMQVRFDGSLGFPGGHVNEGEHHVDALNRELEEEMSLDTSKHAVQDTNFLVSYYNHAKRLYMHFYTLEVTVEDLRDIERNALNADEYGAEVMGTIRVPLYTMADGHSGLPAFLNNAFVGSAKQQLLHGLQHLDILSAEEVRKAVHSRPLS